VIIDLHMHTSTGSDGRMTVEEVVAEAADRGLDVMSISDHDSVAAQARALELAREEGIRYIHGVELNVTFSHPDYLKGKARALDFLGYGYDPENGPLTAKLRELAAYREKRGAEILEKLNHELGKEGIQLLTAADMEAIQATVDGSMGRPHIANYLIAKGLVPDKETAFHRYLVKCNVPKMPLSLEEAAELVHGAGGILILAHPDDPNGTSLRPFTESLEEQQEMVAESILDFIDGIECWHSRLTPEASESYLTFARKHDLVVTGGSDCHQQPILMGSVDVPDWVVEQDPLSKRLIRH
jgi:predicted metal-dependent phosphoesterase TrpH